MNADWEDAPSYLRKKKTNPGLIAGMLIGCALTAMGLSIGSKFLPEKQSEPTVTETPQYAPPYEETEPTQYSEPTPEERFWKDQERRQREKQVVFNDSNYMPRGAENVVSTESIRQPATYQDEPGRNGNSSQVAIEKDRQWIRRWGGGGSYLAAWTAVNNQIDGRSVCANHKKGSIDYRECRKAAKQFFHEQCRAGSGGLRLTKRYCSAASRFSPMG